jgi:putative ATP-binding cassette transporter
MILKRLLHETNASFKKIAVLGIISGLSSSIMLAVLNKAAGEVHSGDMNIRGFLLFSIALMISSYTKKISVDRTQSIVQNILRGVRIRLADKIRKSSLIAFEAAGVERFYVALTHQTSLISNSSLSLINASQSLVVIVACIAYIGWLSLASLLAIFVFIAFGVAVYQFKDSELQPELAEAAQKESQFFNLLNHVLDGFKELVLCRRKSRHIFDDFNKLSDDTTNLKVATSSKLTDTVMFSQAYMYGLIALLVIVFPYFKLTPQDTVPKLIVAILFFWTSLESVVAAIPDYFKVVSAIGHIRNLETQLETIEDEAILKTASQLQTLPFQNSLVLDQVAYSHRDVDGSSLFSIGPLDLRLDCGQIIFICGGNGSGKTTLMKVLCSLYPLSTGKLLLDDKVITTPERAAFRQTFSAVFSDYHLFDKLYGLKNIHALKVNDLLGKLGLAEKTRFVQNGFSTTRLSFGQQKRLAIIAALLEDRPIYLLDEPAAGFDPVFRKYFYEDFLPELRAQGKTIIVVTHDDRYFSCCDHIVKLDQGRIVEDHRP